MGCRACTGLDELLALGPAYLVEAASVQAVRDYACPALQRGVNLVLLSIGAFADASFYDRVQQAAREGGARVHLASGAIGGFDVLQTVTLMAQALRLAETAGIETDTGAEGFRGTPVWSERLLEGSEKTTVFAGNAREAIEVFPRRVNVAVAAALATAGPEATGVTLHAVPGWRGDDHRITARGRRRPGGGGRLLGHQRHRRMERRRAAAQLGFPDPVFLSDTKHSQPRAGALLRPGAVRSQGVRAGIQAAASSSFWLMRVCTSI